MADEPVIDAPDWVYDGQYGIDAIVAFVKHLAPDMDMRDEAMLHLMIKNLPKEQT